MINITENFAIDAQVYDYLSICLDNTCVWLKFCKRFKYSYNIVYDSCSLFMLVFSLDLFTLLSVSTLSGACSGVCGVCVNC